MAMNAFRCKKGYMLMYLTSSAAAAAMVVLVILKDRFADTKYRYLRPVPFAFQMAVGAFSDTNVQALMC